MPYHSTDIRQPPGINFHAPRRNKECTQPRVIPRQQHSAPAQHRARQLDRRQPPPPTAANRRVRVTRSGEDADAGRDALGCQRDLSLPACCLLRGSVRTRNK